MTPAQRKQAERQRKRAAGLAPLEVWAKPEHHGAIKAYAYCLGTQWDFPEVIEADNNA